MFVAVQQWMRFAFLCHPPGGLMKTVFQKSLLVCLLGSAGLSAQAEGFNFYALLDGGIASTSISHGGGSKTEFVTGGYAPNFMGMSSEKTLGNGLSAGFKLEQGFLLNAKDGTYWWFGKDSLFNRQANLYVKGGFGTVTAGTQGNLAFSSVLLGEPRAGSNYGSALASIAIDGGLGTVDQGAIAYTSPTVNGWTGAAAYVPETASVKSGERYSVTYASKDYAATLAGYANDLGASKAKGYVAGASYKLGALTVKGLFMNQDNGSTLANLETYGAGGSYAVTPELTADFGLYKSSDSAASYKTSTFAVGLQYKFLKDLVVYGQYANVKNQDVKDAAFNFAGPTLLTGSVAAGQTASTVNVGLLYSFF
jgi:predicted porin